MARSFSSKPAGFVAIGVGYDRDPRDGSGTATKLRVLPISASTGRFRKKDESVQFSPGIGNDLGQLPKAGASAGAMRMREHHERRVWPRALDGRCGWPVCPDDTEAAGGVFISEQEAEPERHCPYPGRAQAGG